MTLQALVLVLLNNAALVSPSQVIAAKWLIVELAVNYEPGLGRTGPTGRRRLQCLSFYP